VTTALLFAAALTLEQAAPAPSVTSPTPATQPQSIPTAQAPAQAPSADAPPSPPAVSTTPQDRLEPAPSVRPFEMPPSPPAPGAYAAADPEPKTPVKVEDYHRSYEGPKDATEVYYDAGVKGAFAAEQALRGRLDGIWTVSAADGAPLLSLVISDPGGPDGVLGGAWRDLSRAPGPDSSGVIERMVREGEAVVVRIRPHEDGPTMTLRLQPAADGRWRGELLDAGKARAVVMDRKAL
jgi:hypothetical protein